MKDNEDACIHEEKINIYINYMITGCPRICKKLPPRPLDVFPSYLLIKEDNPTRKARASKLLNLTYDVLILRAFACSFEQLFTTPSSYIGISLCPK